MSKLTVTVFYMSELETPFICAVNGSVTTGVLDEIEGDIQNFEDSMFEDGPGEYTFSVTREPGQYGEYGMCEIAPYWDFNLELFSDFQNSGSDLTPGLSNTGEHCTK